MSNGVHWGCKQENSLSRVSRQFYLELNPTMSTPVMLLIRKLFRKQLQCLQHAVCIMNLAKQGENCLGNN